VIDTADIVRDGDVTPTNCDSLHTVEDFDPCELCHSLVSVAVNSHLMIIRGNILRPVRFAVRGASFALDTTKRYVRARDRAGGVAALHTMGQTVAENPVMVLEEFARVGAL